MILLLWILAAIGAFCPFRAAAHLVPTLLVVCFLLGSDTIHRRTLLSRIGLLTVAIVGWALITSMFSSSVTLQSTLLWGLTWSAVAVLVLPLPKDRVLSALPKIELLALWIIGLQGAWGLVQFIYGGYREGTFDISTGDYIDGFAHPALNASGTFANPIFSAGFVVLLLISFGAYLRGQGLRYLLGAIFAAGVVASASVLHQVAFLVVVLIAATVLLAVKRRTPIHFVPVAALLAVLASTTVVLQPKNVRSGAALAGDVAASIGTEASVDESAAKKTLTNRPTQTIADTYRAMTREQRDELSGLVYGAPNAKVTLAKRIYAEARENLLALVLGWGPGTFASRTAAIRTGSYFGGPKAPRRVPGLDTEVTPLFEKHLIHPWFGPIFASANFGSTQKPFSSWMSVLSEAGLFGIAALCVLGWMAARTLAPDAPYVWATLVFLFLVGFFFLLGFQEHYWEMPQIATLQLLTIRMYFAVARPSSA